MALWNSKTNHSEPEVQTPLNDFANDEVLTAETTASVETEPPAVEHAPQQPLAHEPADDGMTQLFQRIKAELHRQVIARMDLSTIGTMREDDLRTEVRNAAEQLLIRRRDLLNLAERERLINEVIDEVFGLGPLEPLFRDKSITDILINGAKTVYVERNGRLERAEIKFADDNHVINIVQRIVSAVGRRIDETSPMVDARLPDGSRLNAIIPPLAVDGPLVSIRRFGARPLGVDDLLSNQSIVPEIIQFLSACVQGRMNILISGGTGSGKTTLLNILSGFIPDDERVATIEDAAELQLQQPHVVRMETRPPNVEGTGEVATRDLVRNALRMRPDRIVVGECRGAEALDMLHSGGTGVLVSATFVKVMGWAWATASSAVRKLKTSVNANIRMDCFMTASLKLGYRCLPLQSIRRMTTPDCRQR